MQAPWFMNLQLTSHPKICSLFCVVESSSSCGFGNKELTADLQSPGGQRVNSKKIPTESIREAPCFGRYVLAQHHVGAGMMGQDMTRHQSNGGEKIFLGLFSRTLCQHFISTWKFHMQKHAHTHTFTYFVDIYIYTQFIYTLTHPCIHRPSCELHAQADYPSDE